MWQCIVLALSWLEIGTSLLPASRPASVRPSRLVPGASPEIVTELTGDELAARTQAFIWIFGASGAAGIARSQFPKMASNVLAIQSLKDQGRPGVEGEMLGLNPLCGYPRDVARAEVLKVVTNRMSAEEIVKKYPVPGNYLVSKGFLAYEAFAKANANADPLAVRAVFDCFNQGTNIVDPDVAQKKIETFKANVDAVKIELLKSKVVGWAAIVFLLGLLGYADIEAYINVYKGYFPDWPGGRLWLQGGLWDPDIGVQHIPEYWK